jgi:hypothetical protein
MLAHVVGYIVSASGRGSCGRAYMRKHPQGRAAGQVLGAGVNRRAIVGGDLGACVGRPRPRLAGASAARAAAPNRLKRLVCRHQPAPTKPKAAICEASSCLHGPTIDALGEDVGQVSLWIELIEFCSLNQRRGTSPTECSLIMTRKEVVLSCHHDQTIGARRC